MIGSTDKTPPHGGRTPRGTPTLAQLRAFEAVCLTEHFGRAAQRLGIGQPTLSQTIAALEVATGTVLFERSTRRVVVAPAGRRLLPYATAALRAFDELNRVACRLEGLLAGGLRLGLIPTLAPYVLPAILGAAARRHPDLQIEVHEAQTDGLPEALHRGAIDAALLALPTGDPAVQKIHLYDEAFVALVPATHPWAGRPVVEVAEVGEARLLLLEPGHCLRDQTLELCAERARADTGGLMSLATIVQLVAAGLGVTVVPTTALAVEAATPGVVQVALRGTPPPGRRIGLAFRASSSAPEFGRLAELIRDAVVEADLPVRPVGGRAAHLGDLGNAPAHQVEDGSPDGVSVQ